MSSSYTTPPPSSANLLISNPRPHILLITVNRPAQFNAFLREMHPQLDDLLNWYDSQPSLRACILTGKGKAFCSGADLQEWSKLNKLGQAGSMLKLSDNGFGGISNRRGKKPIIAAVHGSCLGGGMEMALNCDLVIAHEGARFSLPEVKIGVVAVAGGLPRMMHILGRQRATEMALLGRMYSAEKMASWGVVNEVVKGRDAEGSVVEAAVKWAEELAKNSPDSVIVSREGLLGGWDGVDPRESTRAVDDGIYKKLDGGYNYKEGVLSFVERRKPVYKDSKL